MDEQAFFTQQTAAINSWFESPRFRGTKRSWDASKIAQLRGTLTSCYPSDIQATKLFNLVTLRSGLTTPVYALGCSDPHQATQRSAKQEVCYVSARPASADGPKSNISAKAENVDRIFRTQLMSDRHGWHEWIGLSNDERRRSVSSGQGRIDYLKPIIADTDIRNESAHEVMEIAKKLAECGAAAIHLKDAYDNGRILVPQAQHISRLLSARFQWDIMGINNLVIAQTSANTAQHLVSSVDVADHKFIQGIAEPAELLASVLFANEVSGASPAELASIEAKWLEAHPLVTFDECAERALADAGKSDSIQAYRYASAGRSLDESRRIAESFLGREIFFDWDAPRTREGYHRICGNKNMALKRALAFAPYADMLWLEAASPDLAQAKEFAASLKAEYPEKLLVYHLCQPPTPASVSSHLAEADLREFSFELAKCGYVLQVNSQPIDSSSALTDQRCTSLLHRQKMNRVFARSSHDDASAPAVWLDSSSV